MFRSLAELVCMMVYLENFSVWLVHISGEPGAILFYMAS